MSKRNKTKKMGTTKSAEISKGETAKSMGLEFANEFVSEMGSKFAATPGKASKSNKKNKK
ncbi:hypothetical protein [Tepidibacter mesophilus]|uniref:hypothetical protein n=1 Tax=Tepidibacter mesophilus TaxID=655607 RepID=UPI000C07AB50|nr:hypothetical protein [Tepidibacter mesophilus]